jgi:hypothetical protein
VPGQRHQAHRGLRPPEIVLSRARAIVPLPGIRQTSKESRVILARLPTKALEVLCPLTEILIDLFAICRIKSKRPKNLFKGKSGERLGNPFRRLASQEREYDGIQGDAGSRHEVRAGTFLYIFFCDVLTKKRRPRRQC